MTFKLAIAVLAGATLLAGCASARVGLSSSAPPSMRGSVPPAGTSYTSAVIHAEASPNVYFGLLFLGYFAIGVQDDYRGSGSGSARRNPPQLAEDRAIAERDCSRPMDTPSANLRCK